jgi:hypothetical protein
MMKGLILCGFVVLGASAHAVVVDDFMTGSYNSGAFSSGTVSNWSSATVPGSIRFTSLTIDVNPFGGDAKTRVITTPGILEVSTDTDVDTHMLLGYGFDFGSTAVGSNPLNMDFSSSPILNVTFRSNDLAQPVFATIYTNNGASSFTRSLNVMGGITPSSPVTYGFDFTSDAGSLTDVDAITFNFDPAPGGDFSLQGVYSVPEPASVAVLAIGAAAMLRRRKK